MQKLSNTGYVIKIAATGEVTIELVVRVDLLHELQELVGGYIETVRLANQKHIMIVNEDGILRGLPYNQRASAIINYRGGIVGDAIICKAMPNVIDAFDSYDYVKKNILPRYNKL